MGGVNRGVLDVRVPAQVQVVVLRQYNLIVRRPRINGVNRGVFKSDDATEIML